MSKLYLRISCAVRGGDVCNDVMLILPPIKFQKDVGENKDKCLLYYYYNNSFDCRR